MLPEYQRQGIGKPLAESGLNRLRQMDARGCCLVDHPDYHGRFGFTNPLRLAVEGMPRDVFFAMALDG